MLFGSLRFQLVENHSGMLGYYGFLPPDLKEAILIWGVALLVLVLFLILLFVKKISFSQRLSITLIMAGASGNLFDRIVNDGGVIDFLILSLGFTQTGIFNLADLYILIGSFHIGYTLMTGKS